MTVAGVWLPTSRFADLAGISRQAAARILKCAYRGEPWNDATLTVRPVLSRGGRSGLAYEVSAETLPLKLRLQQFSPAAPVPPTRQTSYADASALRSRLDLIGQIVAHPKGSPERNEAIAQAQLAADCSLRTVYRWVDRYERHGVRGLERALPSNRGERRVLVSRPFDKALRQAGHTEQTLDEVRTRIEQAIKGLWASRAEQAGVTEIRRLAEFMLLELCEEQGLHLPRAALKLSRRYVERFAHYRVVNQRRNDRKAFDDQKPRIRRDWTALAPMERVVADVKHLDVVVRREDGSTAWPKIVAFMDAGTGRVFVHPVLLDKGEGVRQEHVIEAFLAMVAAPGWGFPQGLYLDNGAEFGALAKIDHALQLINEPGARTLIYARPYNAAAKPIESLFARLDRYVFSQLPGYAGPNRMAAKTQTVGKPPKPYPGPWLTFCTTVGQLVEAYNHRPVGGPWNDRSPTDWLEGKALDGWKPVTVEDRVLDAAFCDHDSRRVDRGVIRVNGQRYSHPGLAALPSRTVVDLALPWRRGAAPLVRVGGTWVYLEPDIPYPARWVEGAKESSRRQSSQAAYVRDLARDAPAIDPVAAKIRWASRAPAVSPPRAGSSLDLGAELSGRARDATTDPPGAPSSPAELRRARERAVTERLEKRQQTDE